MKVLAAVVVLLYAGRSCCTTVSCAYYCTVTVRYTQSCGWFNWGTCTRYRTEGSTCYNTGVHGEWSGWSTSGTGSCSVTCGPGTRQRSFVRSCNSPAPSYCGAPCPGANTKVEHENCSAACCPVNGSWSDWQMQTVSNCSAPCGGGVRNVTYARTCSNPPPSCGGATCSGSNTSDVQEVCNTQFCPVDGGWSDWYKEYNSSCSVTCGGGQMNVTYIRFCDNPPPQYGGKDCEGDNTTTITVPCNTQKCPVDGGWSTWKAEDSGRCSVTCGGGQKNVTNKRHCDSPEPQYGGQDCAGDDIKVITESCNTSPCPINGGWSSWHVDTNGTCSVTCGAGVMNVTYRRTCDNPAPQFGGNTCTGGKKRTRIAACVAPPCLVAGGKREWGMWSDVGECSALCGGGHLQRTREGKCDNSDPAYGDCIGVVKETETVVCNDGDCGDRCPENNVTSIPQPTNDHLYYLCDNGVAVLTSCGVGHVWSQQNSTCV
ncbi:hemicentin-1-like [Pomacea canaliculata]|uniref:hemicentin-1-like n=1 Tax=Pomacea canaliculata TaxID=400727 RepID=UPI000D72D0CF|nr:hemicentin-1-like [Pomacea canaliculata]